MVPSSYPGGLLLAVANKSRDDIRLCAQLRSVANLKEGLRCHSARTGRTVMGMVEFLWGCPDGN